MYTIRLVVSIFSSGVAQATKGIHEQSKDKNFIYSWSLSKQTTDARERRASLTLKSNYTNAYLKQAR